MSEKMYSFDETDVKDEQAQEVLKDGARVRLIIASAKTKVSDKPKSMGDFRLGLVCGVLHPDEDRRLSVPAVFPTFGVPIRNKEFEEEHGKRHIPTGWTKKSWKEFCIGVLSDQGHVADPIVANGVGTFNDKEITIKEAGKIAADLSKKRLEEAVACLENKGAEYKDCVLFATLKQNPSDDGSRMFYQLNDMATENDYDQFEMTDPEDLVELYNPYGSDEEEEEAPKKKTRKKPVKKKK